MIAEQLPMFKDIGVKKKPMRDSLIKSVSFDEKQILRWIMYLFLNDKPFDCDPTFSKGVIWRGLQEPKHKFDIRPVRDDVQQANAESLPFAEGALKSIFFDPPFLVKTGGNSIIKDRFSAFPDTNSLWGFYEKSLAEFYRILASGGILTFKCQDFVLSGRQVVSHWKIVTLAQEIGFRSEDTFIYVNDHPIVHTVRQKHARKIHCYFLVFQK